MHFQSLVVTSLRRTAYFDLAIVSAALLGVVGEADSPPIFFFTRPMARLASAHRCLVLQGVSKHLGYLLSLDSQTCPIWKVTRGIHSDFEGTLSLLMFPTFLEEAPKWSLNFLFVPA